MTRTSPFWLRFDFYQDFQKCDNQQTKQLKTINKKRKKQTSYRIDNNTTVCLKNTSSSNKIKIKLKLLTNENLKMRIWKLHEVFERYELTYSRDLHLLPSLDWGFEIIKVSDFTLFAKLWDWLTLLLCAKNFVFFTCNKGLVNFRWF